MNSKDLEKYMNGYKVMMKTYDALGEEAFKIWVAQKFKEYNFRRGCKATRLSLGQQIGTMSEADYEKYKLDLAVMNEFALKLSPVNPTGEV